MKNINRLKKKTSINIFFLFQAAVQTAIEKGINKTEDKLVICSEILRQKFDKSSPALSVKEIESFEQLKYFFFKY